jgi:hypothetical protein
MAMSNPLGGPKSREVGFPETGFFPQWGERVPIPDHAIACIFASDNLISTA